MPGGVHPLSSRKKREKTFLEGQQDLEARTTAVLSGSEMDFYRLVTLGDKERVAQKQLVLYETARGLYDNPFVRERIGEARRRVPKESRSSRFWRISGYASPAFLVGFAAAFYMLISGAINSRALIEKTSQIPIYQAEVERQAAERKKLESELETWKQEHADVLERKKRVATLESDAATYRTKIDHVTSVRNELLVTLENTTTALSALQKRYDAEQQARTVQVNGLEERYTAQVKGLEAEVAKYTELYTTERAAHEKAEGDLKYREENKADIRVVSSEMGYFGDRFVFRYNLCASNPVGAWLSSARVQIWKTNGASQDSAHIKQSTQPLVFEHVPLNAVRVDGDKCVYDRSRPGYQSPPAVRLSPYSSFLQGPNWIEATLSGWDDNKHEVSVTISAFYQE